MVQRKRYELALLTWICMGSFFAVRSAARFETGLQSAVAFAISCSLFAVAWIDGHTMEIPDSLNGIILILGTVWIFLRGDISWGATAAGFFVIAFPMFIMDRILPGSFGGGDIKLCAACGLMLGWQKILAAVLTALVLAVIWGAYLVMARKKRGTDCFALGPFLVLGILLYFFAGDELTGVLHPAII